MPPEPPRTFDTDTAIKELVGAGMPEPQARAITQQRAAMDEHNFAVKYDTQAAIKKLIESGVPEPQARVVVRQCVEIAEYNFTVRHGIKTIRRNPEPSRKAPDTTKSSDTTPQPDNRTPDTKSE